MGRIDNDGGLLVMVRLMVLVVGLTISDTMDKDRAVKEDELVEGG